jgi:hypothetical protein
MTHTVITGGGDTASARPSRNAMSRIIAVSQDTGIWRLAVVRVSGATIMTHTVTTGSGAGASADIAPETLYERGEFGGS